MVLESPNHCPSWPHMVLPVPHDAEGGRGCLLPLLDPSQLLSQLCPALTNIQTQLSVQTSPPDRCSWLRNQFLYCSIKQCRAAVLYFLHKLCWGPWQWIKAQREPSAFAAAWSNLCKCWMWECGPIPMISRGVTFFALWKIHCFHIFSALSCHCNHCGTNFLPEDKEKTGGKVGWLLPPNTVQGCCCWACGCWRTRDSNSGAARCIWRGPACNGFKEIEQFLALPSPPDEPAEQNRLHYTDWHNNIERWVVCEVFLCKMLRELQEGAKTLLKPVWI